MLARRVKGEGVFAMNDPGSAGDNRPLGTVQVPSPGRASGIHGGSYPLPPQG